MSQLDGCDANSEVVLPVESWPEGGFCHLKTERTGEIMLGTRARKLAGPLALALACAGLMGGGLQPAQAAGVSVSGTGNGNWLMVAQWYDHMPASEMDSHWYGYYNTSEGPGFCLEPSKFSPIDAHNLDPEIIDEFASDQMDGEGQPVELTTAQVNQLAWLGWYVKENLQNPDGSIDEADAMAIKAAMESILNYTHVYLALDHGVTSAPRAYNLTLNDGADTARVAKDHDNGSGIVFYDEAVQLWHLAQANANNWDGETVDWTNNADQVSQPGDELTASVTLPGLNAGFPVTFTVKDGDGAIIDEEEVDTDATGSAAFDYFMPDGDFGDFTINYSVADVPPRYPTVTGPSGWKTDDASTQALMLLTSPARSASGSDPFEVADQRDTRDMPSITTQISSQRVLPGETIFDNVYLTGLNPDTFTYTVSGVLVLVPPASPGICPGPGDSAWQSATTVLTVSPVILKPGDIGDDGTASLKVGQWTAPYDQPDVCVSYGETLTARPIQGGDDIVIEHEVGQASQTAFVLDGPAPFNANTGGGVASLSGGGLAGAGALCVMAAVLAIVWLGRIRPAKRHGAAT